MCRFLRGLGLLAGGETDAAAEQMEVGEAVSRIRSIFCDGSRRTLVFSGYVVAPLCLSCVAVSLPPRRSDGVRRSSGATLSLSAGLPVVRGEGRLPLSVWDS